MIIFEYKGKNQLGEIITGDIEGKDESSVANALIQAGIFPIYITEKEALSGQLKRKRYKPIDLLIFTRQMYTLIKSGIPLSKALRTMEYSNQNPLLKDIFREIRMNIDNGYTLSSSLQKHPKFFNNFYINMVRIGELTGKIEEVFLKLYEYIEFEQAMKNSAKNALRYPILVVISISIAFVIMMTMVIPAFAKAYGGFGAELPWQTQFLINTSNFMTKYFFIIGLFIFGIGYLFRSYINSDTGKIWWGSFKFKIPIIGPILKKTSLARFSKSFSLSLQSGIPIVQSLGYISPVLDNAYLSIHFDQIRQNIEKGNTLYSSMRATGIFTPLVLEMYATGEEAGDLDNMTAEVANLYDKEIEYEMKNINSLIEPIMLVLLGGLILIFALGIFLPIWDLAKIVQ